MSSQPYDKDLHLYQLRSARYHGGEKDGQLLRPELSYNYQPYQFSLPVPQLGQSQDWLTLNRFNTGIQSLQLDLGLPSNNTDIDFLNNSPLFNQTQLQADQNHRDFLTGLAFQSTNNDALKLQGNLKMNDWKSGTEQLQNDIFKDTGFVKETFADKFSNSTFGQNFGTWNAGLNIGNHILTGAVSDKMFGGPKGHLTQAIDSGWNTASDIVSNFGPYGQVVGLAMKGASVLNKGVNLALGNSALDNMTTTDAILNNPLTGWNVGLVNALGGKNAHTITKDEEVQEQIGASYEGSYGKIDDALTKSGKRYGLFSSGSRHAANREIDEARRQQAIMSDVAGEAQDRFAIRNSMSAINGNRRMFALQGGYDQGAIRVGRNGLSLKNVLTAKRVVSSLKFKQQPKVESFKEGGILEVTLNSVPEEFIEQSVLEEVTLESIIPQFKEGGTVNVIPDGALHARLHHMDNADNLTKKGIPVVSEKEGGELEQQAEIERDEIIFRLEVTQKLEELMKKYNNDESSQKEKDEIAIEAGKLLVEEILNNTIDNTGLLNTIE